MLSRYCSRGVLRDQGRASGPRWAMTATLVRNRGVLTRLDDLDGLVNARLDPVLATINWLRAVGPGNVRKPTLAVDLRICLSLARPNPKMDQFRAAHRRLPKTRDSTGGDDGL